MFIGLTPALSYVASKALGGRKPHLRSLGASWGPPGGLLGASWGPFRGSGRRFGLKQYFGGLNFFQRSVLVLSWGCFLTFLKYGNLL